MDTREVRKTAEFESEVLGEEDLTRVEVVGWGKTEFQNFQNSRQTQRDQTIKP